MDDERQDSLREEQRRMRGPYPIGMEDYSGPAADFSWTGMFASVVIVLLLLGAGIFLLDLAR